MATVPFHEARLLRASPGHIRGAIKKSLPDGFVADDIKLGAVRFGRQYEVYVEIPVRVAVRRRTLTTGHEKTGRYKIVIDVHDPNELRVSEFFEWKDWSDTRGLTKGSASRSNRR